VDGHLHPSAPEITIVSVPVTWPPPAGFNSVRSRNYEATQVVPLLQTVAQAELKA
jgi:hypothetical protein